MSEIIVNVVPEIVPVVQIVVDENSAQTALDAAAAAEAALAEIGASVYYNYFKGVHLTEAALNTAHPTGVAGDYAQVNEVGSTDVVNYSWDTEENIWVKTGTGGSGAINTDTLPEGSTNLYFTESRVRASLLTGLSLLTGGIIATTDSILVAFGKIQKQLTDGFTTANIKSILGITTLSGSNTGDQDLTPYLKFIKSLTTTISESFGDSISAQYGITAGTGYAELFSTLFGLNNTNRAVSSTGINNAVLLHNLNVNVGHKKATIFMSGFNDVRQGGNAAKTISKIKNGYRAVICNQFLKTYIPAKNTGGTITTSGTWADYNAATVGGKSAVGGSNATIGSYKEYAFTGDNVVLALIGSDGTTFTHGNFDVHIDGVLIGNYTGNNKTDGLIGNSLSPYILYFGNLTDSPHTIRVTLTTANTIIIDYFGNLKYPQFTTPLFFVQAPKMDATGYAASGGLATDSIIDELNTEMINVVNEFSSGYPITVTKTNDFYNISNGLSADHIHPNELGHRQIYSAMIDANKSLAILNNVNEISVVKIGANTTLNNSYCGKVILITTSCTITLPNGLMKGFNYTLKTRAGVTLTYVFGGSVTVLDNLGTTMAEKLSHTMANTDTTDEYLSVGAL